MALPQTTRAQANADSLRATIKAALLSDPRTSGLSPAQIDAMVGILAQEAQRQGMTAGDITWRPSPTPTFGANAGDSTGATACGSNSFLCRFNEAFGFAGNDPTIPFVLGASSMGLVWILAEMLHRRRHPQFSQSATTPSSM